MKYFKFGMVKPGSGYKQFFIEIPNILYIEFHWYLHGIGFNVFGRLFECDWDYWCKHNLKKYYFRPIFILDLNTILGGVNIVLCPYKDDTLGLSDEDIDKLYENNQQLQENE